MIQWWDEQLRLRVDGVIDDVPTRLGVLVRRPVVGQIFRFGIVGVANTLVYYLFYRLLLTTGMPYVVAHLIAWAISVVFSFYANCYFTYRVLPTWRRFIAFPATTFVNVAFTTVGSVLLVNMFSADTRYITLLMGILAIPVTFLVTRMVLVGRTPGSPGQDWAALGHSFAAPLTAAFGAIVANVLVASSLGLTPFGDIGRGVGDYGPQYLPFHLYLHDVLWGRSMGDAAFTWSGAAGVDFLPTYATYLGGPFTLLVGVLPLRWMDLSILLISLLRIGAAAAAMMALLQAMRPRAPKLAGVALSIGYATSSWVIQLGMSTPQWLDGLFAFPLFCLAGVLTVRHRAVVAPVAMVALGWWSNYYSAMMASIGAAVFLLAWLIATKGPLLRGLIGFALRGALGGGTAAWLLWPTLKAVRNAAPAAADLNRVPPDEMTLRLFGFTAGSDFPPMLFAGSLLLVAVSALLLSPALALSARITWFLLTIVAVMSLRWKVAIQLFNGGDVPNGNAYRWSFVIVGLLVISGWHAFTERPDALKVSVAKDHRGWLTRTQLLLALLIVSLLVWHASGVDADLSHVTHSVWWAGPYIAIAVLFGCTFMPARWRNVVQVLLIFGVLVELVWSGVIITPHSRHNYGVSAPYLKVSVDERKEAAAILAAAQWPEHRTGGRLNSEKPRWNIPNDPYRYGLPGVEMYASTLPAEVENTLAEFGLWATQRKIYDHRPSLLTDNVLSISSRFDHATNSVITNPVLPMMRTLTRPETMSTEEAEQWRAMFNREVVTTPEYTLRWEDREAVDISNEGVTISRSGKKLVYNLRCAVGSPTFRTPSQAGYVWVNSVEGELVVGSLAAYLKSAPTSGSNEVVAFGADGQFLDDLAPAREPVKITYLSPDGESTPLGLVLCVDQRQLLREISTTELPAITVDANRITGVFAGPQSGQVVIATTMQDGWTCRADGKLVTPQSRNGLLAVPVDGATEISCDHRTPGLKVGILGSLISLAGAVGLVLLAGRRKADAASAQRSR